MAEGGYDPNDSTNERTPLIPNKGGDDDDFTLPSDTDLSKWYFDKDGKLIPTRDPDSTQPFKPGASSTPAAGGEQIPMGARTKLPKERGPRTQETSFIEGGFRAGRNHE